MDIATFVGMLLGMGAIVASIPLAGVPITAFVNYPSILIVCGGCLAALLINYPLGDVIKILKIVPVTFKQKKFDPIPTVNQMIQMVDQGVKRGNAALEAIANEVGDPFMKRGILLVASNMPDDQIRFALETELEFTESRHSLGESFFNMLAAYGPAYGMLGTLIGLIAMLRNLGGSSAVEAIGSGMAVALITTFYGSIIANLFGLPLAGKLKQTHEEEYTYKRLVVEGLLLVNYGIREGLPPSAMGERLGMYIPPSRRAEIQASRSSAA